MYDELFTAGLIAGVCGVGLVLLYWVGRWFFTNLKEWVNGLR